MNWLADEPPMCSVSEFRQTPGNLHRQKSKAQGDTVPSDPFLSLQAANMAAGNLFLSCSLGRTQAPCLGDWQTNHLCAQFFGTGRLLEVCTTRDLKLRVLWCRQTPGGLHHQRSKAQGDTVPSAALLSWQGANMATVS